MSWQTQGRQDHGWFGHGTGSGAAGEDPDTLFEPGNLAARVAAMASPVIAHLPRAERHRQAADFGSVRLDQLRTVASVWSAARLLSQDAFERRFTQGLVSGTAARRLRAAADGASAARTHEALGRAGAELAGAMLSIGLDRWPGVLRDVADRTGSGRGVAAAQDSVQARSSSPTKQAGLPQAGEASTYSDYFVGRPTSSGQAYSHDGYTAALLPKSRWNALPLGTKLRITYAGRSVVVEVNDRGAGNGQENRVLDLSRAAMAFLTGRRLIDVSNQNAGLIQLEKIEVVPNTTKVGPG